MIPSKGAAGPVRSPAVPGSAGATTGSHITGPSPEPDRDPPTIGGTTAGPRVETEPAPGPLASAGSPDPPAAITRIVVPLDGSDLAGRAVPPAEALAARLGASLIFVQAAGAAQVPGLDVALALELGETDALLTLQQASAAARRKGLQTEDGVEAHRRIGVDHADAVGTDQAHAAGAAEAQKLGLAPAALASNRVRKDHRIAGVTSVWGKSSPLKRRGSPVAFASA